MSAPYVWDHLSLTGPGAGLTACGKKLADVHATGETTAHIPYSYTDQNIRDGYRCTVCVQAWFGEVPNA
jgi:hypothetical protein